MKARLLTGPDPSRPGKAVLFWCPGCDEAHTFEVLEVMVNGVATYPQGPHQWEWDGNLESPTLAPSLLYPEKKIRCHLFLKNGIIDFLGDCGHALAGQKVPIADIPEDSGWARKD